MTYNYNIKLLSDDPENVEKSKKEIRKKTRDLTCDILRGNGSNSKATVISKRRVDLAHDLLAGRFWGVLHYIDGNLERDSLFGNKIKEVELRREKARQWAQKEFRPFEIQKILNVIVNQAILRPYRSNLPGTRRGHSTLYEELVMKDDSMFKDAVTEDLHKRLNNGIFWEELMFTDSPSGVRNLGEVLEDHFDDLDVNFAQKGVDIINYFLERNNFKIDDIRINLHHIGEKALDNYALFLNNLDENGGLPKDYSEHMVKAYISEILRWDGDREGPYYDGNDTFDPNEVRGDVRDKIKVDIVQKYLKKSKDIRDYVAKDLSETIKYIQNDCNIVSMFVKDVVENCPEPQYMMTETIRNLTGIEAVKFVEESKKGDCNLSSLISVESFSSL